MFEFFNQKKEEKPKTESELMGDRVRAENEALLRAEKHYLYNPSEEEIREELRKEAEMEDGERRKAA